MKWNKHTVIGVVIVLLVTIGFYRYFFKSWAPYYQEKLQNKEPRPLLIKAIEFFGPSAHEKNALDVGAGVGNDTLFLLKNGWHVWANDIEEEAIKIMESRKDIEPYKDKLTLVQKSFTDLPWGAFPKFNFIYAGYSLPFAQPNEFMKIWEAIVNQMPAGGIFAGHFFGQDHGGFNWWAKRKMTFFTKEEVLKLFDRFKIEFFEEFNEKNDKGILDHSFNIVAKKL